MARLRVISVKFAIFLNNFVLCYFLCMSRSCCCSCICCWFLLPLLLEALSSSWQAKWIFTFYPSNLHKFLIYLRERFKSGLFWRTPLFTISSKSSRHSLETPKRICALLCSWLSSLTLVLSQSKSVLTVKPPSIPTIPIFPTTTAIISPVPQTLPSFSLPPPSSSSSPRYKSPLPIPLAKVDSEDLLISFS